jgi:hypothetical protein
VTRTADTRWARVLLMILAFLGAALLGGYQRRTGPSYPVKVQETLAGGEVSGRLPRSHPGEGDAVLSLQAPSGVNGELVWRRYPTAEAWTHLPLIREGETLTASLPHQPPAAKLEYSLRLRAGGDGVTIPAEETVLIRFRGAVPTWVLILHVFCMFFSLMMGFRASVGALAGESRPSRFVPWVLAFLIPGGLVMGPVVQKLAFGAFWTGWPFGEDWTDNKTLATVLVWVIAALVTRKRRSWERLAILVAMAAMLAVYLIPHSTHGSELDWEAMESEQGRVPAVGLGFTIPRG